MPKYGNRARCEHIYSTPGSWLCVCVEVSIGKVPLWFTVSRLGDGGGNAWNWWNHDKNSSSYERHLSLGALVNEAELCSVYILSSGVALTGQVTCHLYFTVCPPTTMTDSPHFQYSQIVSQHGCFPCSQVIHDSWVRVFIPHICWTILLKDRN